jgi:hypothetical protein
VYLSGARKLSLAGTVSAPVYSSVGPLEGAGMMHLKKLLAGLAAYGIFAMVAWGQGALQSTAPEPATAPSQAATVPQPSTSPSSGVGPAASVTYTFEMLDTNRDNSVSMEEAARLPELVKIFEQLDRNRDGRLDRSEYVNISK